MKKQILPPTYLFIYLLLAIFLHLLIPVRQIITMRFLGIIPLVLGIAINLWTDNLFKKNQTTVRPNEKPNKLISEGIFRYSRHPMYLGFVLILLGVAIQLGSITAFVAPLLMFVTLETKFIPLEEKSLQAEFGKEYLRYKAKVGQWFSLPFNKRF